MVTLPDGYSDVKAYARDLLEFIHEDLSVQITGGIHVNDAFIHDAWGHLPREWTEWWKSFDDYRDVQRDLINGLHEKTVDTRPYLASRPPSLSTWLERIRSLALSREQCYALDEVPAIDIPAPLRSRMNTKKMAEVNAAVNYIKQICNRHGIKRIIDIGSGQGYLSLTLAAVCKFKVLAIDGSAKQIQGSKAASCAAGLTEGVEITHIVRFIDGNGQMVQELQAWCQGEPSMLVGLHACGSLSEHMIRLFTATTEITQLAFAGCCYNHIKLISPSQPDGFPVSRHMREKELRLSTSAMITGCQAPTNWAHDPSSSFSRKYFFRAVLEKLLFDKGFTDVQHRPVWGIRTGDLRDFESYAARALDRLGLKVGIDVTEDELKDYESRFVGREGETAILWTLSVLLCRVVESVIALDRWFYLVEQGSMDVKVLPMFDYRLSPRNLVITARK